MNVGAVNKLHVVGPREAAGYSLLASGYQVPAATCFNPPRTTSALRIPISTVRGSGWVPENRL